MLPAFLTTLLFAMSAVSANRSTRVLGGMEANFWRITLATLLLGLWAHTFGSGVSGAALPYFLISGLVGFGIGDLAFYQTLPRLGSRLSVLLVHCLAAPLAALIEWLWIGTTLSSVQVAASLTILVGVSIALAPGKHLRISKPMLFWGILLGTVAALGQSFGAVLSRKAYQVASGTGQQIDGLTAAYQRIIAGWGVAAIGIVIARRHARSSTDTSGLADLPGQPRPGLRLAWPWVVANAVAGPTLGVGCFQWALATQPTGVILPIVATTPIVVIPFTLLLEGERPRKRSLLGGVIAVLGAIVLAGGAKLLAKLH